MDTAESDVIRKEKFSGRAKEEVAQLRLNLCVVSEAAVVTSLHSWSLTETSFGDPPNTQRRSLDFWT